MTLAETLHFGRAAQEHFIAAQPFGRRIQALEREVGILLFARTSRRVELTPAGERFLTRARRVLGQFDALLDKVEGPRGGPPVLRIGVLGFGLADLWPAVRGLVESRRPDLDLVAVELDWADEYDLLRSGEVDVAIVHDVGGAEDLILDRTLQLDRVVVVPTDSVLVDAEPVTRDDVAGHRWVAPLGAHPGLAEWGGTGESRRQVFVRSPSAVATAVATSGRLGMHAEPAARFFPHPCVRYIPMEGAPATVSVASRPGDHREVVTMFRAAVRAAVAMERTMLGGGPSCESVPSA
ncbi:LysR family transcriptional regulator [Pseudonocardia alni]|uniref:LysR family transcriptional regulator n=1 Tax=Pseudonocardia alni TaxID=33907 RepID=UPI0037CC5AFB